MTISEQIWELRHSFKVTVPLPLDFPDGTTRWICPPGVALGFNEFSNRGMRMGPEITCWPNRKRYAVYFGYNNIEQIHTHRGTSLWPLEAMVYIRERESALTRAIEQLDKLLAPLPRYKYHKNNDTRPFAEDFEWKPKRKKGKVTRLRGACLAL